MLVLWVARFGWVAKDVPLQRPIVFLFGGLAFAGAVREFDFFSGSAGR